MNKEHLETDLTIKASYKVGQILDLTHLQIAPFCIHQEVEYMGVIDQESRSTHNFNVLNAFL